MCPLANLLDPNKIPVEAAELAGLSAGKSAKSILVTVRALIQLFSKERLNYSLDLVKEKIAKADEKERDSFINDIDKMGDDDKKLELIRKNLGLGRWAIGGTKLIYSYDPDQYDKEREARLGQYASGEGLPEAPVGRQADKFGIFSFKDEYTEREGGYDFVFYDVDDAQ
jgi:fructosamine-3-kinase